MPGTNKEKDRKSQDSNHRGGWVFSSFFFFKYWSTCVAKARIYGHQRRHYVSFVIKVSDVRAPPNGHQAPHYGSKRPSGTALWFKMAMRHRTMVQNGHQAPHYVSKWPSGTALWFKMAIRHRTMVRNGNQAPHFGSKRP